MLLLIEQIERICSDKEIEGLYTNSIKRIDLIGIVEYAEKANKKQVNLESVRSTYI